MVELWPILPSAIRAAVLAMVNATAPQHATPVSTEERLERLPPGYEKQS